MAPYLEGKELPLTHRFTFLELSADHEGVQDGEDANSNCKQQGKDQVGYDSEEQDREPFGDLLMNDLSQAGNEDIDPAQMGAQWWVPGVYQLGAIGLVPRANAGI